MFFFLAQKCSAACQEESIQMFKPTSLISALLLSLAACDADPLPDPAVHGMHEWTVEDELAD